MDLDGLAAFVRDNDSFFIVSHDSPDADGLGAQYALARGLETLGKRAIAVNSASYSPRYAFIDKGSRIRSWVPDILVGIDPGDFTVIVVDTHDIGFIGALADVLLPRAAKTIYVDHHEHRGKVSDSDVILSERSSTCEMTFELLERLGVPLEKDTAEALFAGIVYDTGWFAYPKTSLRTYEIALALVGAGVVPNEIRSSLNENSSVGTLLLEKSVLASLVLRSNNRVAVQFMTRSTLEKAGANYDDAEGLINIPLHCRDVEVSVLFKENLEGKLRCSMRSKGKVNCAHIAQTFGGGGHKTAAGFSCPLPLATMLDKMLEILESSLK